jgi:hypothetical protein
MGLIASVLIAWIGKEYLMNFMLVSVTNRKLKKKLNRQGIEKLYYFLHDRVSSSSIELRRKKYCKTVLYVIQTGSAFNSKSQH